MVSCQIMQIAEAMGGKNIGLYGSASFGKSEETKSREGEEGQIHCPTSWINAGPIRLSVINSRFRLNYFGDKTPRGWARPPCSPRHDCTDD